MAFASLDDVGDFAAFFEMCAKNKPKVTEERRQYMASRYHFSGAVTREATMTRGKPLPVGPVTSKMPCGRLPVKCCGGCLVK